MLSEADKQKVKKNDLQQVIENQLAFMNNDPNEIRNVITNTINAAIDNKFEQLSFFFLFKDYFF